MQNTRLDELQKLVIKLERRIASIDAKVKKVSFYRLILFFISLFTVFFAFFYLNTFSTIVAIILTIILQAALSYPHNNLLNSLQNHLTYLNIKKSYISRIKLDWSNIQENAHDYPEINNPAGVDLNLTGHQSLLHLIDLTSSAEARILLGSWLINTKPDYNDIIRRQNLIKELVPLGYFRDKMILIAKLISKKDLNIKGLLNWLKVPADNKKLKFILFFLATLAPVNLILIISAVLGIVPAVLPVFSSLLYMAIYFFNQKYTKDTSENAAFVKDELGKFSRLFNFLENYKYKNNKSLKELCTPFLDKKSAPSTEIKSVKRIIFVLELQKNPILWFLLILIAPLDYIFTVKLNKIKDAISGVLPEWLNVWANLEALISIATFAHLNPGYTFPIIKDNNYLPDKNEIIASEMGHPLIAKSQKICNNFSLKNKGEIAIITGSNMSGKSTFLRTFGINLMLAYSGAPVNAAEFIVPLVRVFTCIKVSDSVIDGISYFYAEVKRLKLLLDQLESDDPRPIIFLIDEIFKGTNNVERLIGSRSYIKALSGKNGSGCVTTHDLELVKLAEEIPNISNYHFREEVRNGMMSFDYQLRQGPCPTTNALRIMQIEGLPVEIKSNI